MNIANGQEQPSRKSVFEYEFESPLWSQVTPQYMPWGHSPASPAAPLVTFSADQATASQHTQTDTSFSMHRSNLTEDSLRFPQTRPNMNCKRKAELNMCLPIKQHITEEKMAAHMSRLHISSESQPDMPSMCSEEPTSREKRLYVCEEMRRLQTESILPTALLGRLERPCMAVMLWQPPAKIPELLGSPPGAARRALAAPIYQPDEEIDNNNASSTLDLNNMEMDT